MFRDDALLFGIYFYLYTWTVLSLGFWPQISLHWKSVRVSSPKIVVLYTSLALSFMAWWSKYLHTTQKLYFTPQQQGSQTQSSDFPGIWSQLQAVGSKWRKDVKRRALWSLPAGSWSVSISHGILTHSLIKRKRIACKEEPLQEETECPPP